MRLVSLAVSILFLLFSCSPPEEERMTKDEAMQLSRAIDSSIRYKKPYYFTSLINEKAFAAKVAGLSGSKISSAEMKGIKDALTQSDMGDKIILAIQDNGFYELVKHYEKDNGHHLIFRLYSDGGLNYHDFELTKRNGKVAIADMFIYLSGEDFSKTIADLLLSFGGKNKDYSSEKYQQVQTVRKIRDLMLKNEPEKALKYYEDLPPDLQNQKSVQLLYIQLCSQVDNETYVKAISDFQLKHPDEPNMHLMMVDAYILRKEYAKAIESINNVDRLINTDPFLDYMRALLYNLLGKPDEARNYLEKLYRNMPDFDDGALELIANYIDADDDVKAKQLIGEYEKNEKYDQSLLDNYLYSKPGFSRE